VSDACHRCPHCGSVDTPTLVVRGSGLGETGLFLKCRDCRSEWADHRSDLRAS
jgi:formate dehydrogenase maturation protein FdhE